MQIREIILAHELDAAWIIAVWKAIHGGDPAPELVAAQAIAALAQYVNPPIQRSFSFVELKEQFAKIGVHVTERTAEESARTAEADSKAAPARDKDEREFRVHQYCFKFKGETYCIELPALTHLRTAA
jgi:hypothetical protein